MAFMRKKISKDVNDKIKKQGSVYIISLQLEIRDTRQVDWSNVFQVWEKVQGGRGQLKMF